MAIDDSLTIKRTLERAIRFEASADSSGAWAVWPYPGKPDVQKICARPDRGGLSAPLCEYYSPQHTTEELRFFDEHDTKLLARRLNELYGKRMRVEWTPWARERILRCPGEQWQPKVDIAPSVQRLAKVGVAIPQKPALADEVKRAPKLRLHVARRLNELYGT